ncbi:Protein NIF3 [Grifola frondosa]|uniref:Protein NIF3 n=1 Tax=Grifola frondosa TaxID=5627 RepID=A0A1C7LUL6_GRIFR|nr:Protein NIF3 [Grifola frondosa]
MGQRRAPHLRPNANRILLTIDLTTAVVEEALSTQTAFIVSYHPPIFKPLSSFTLANSIQSSLLRCAAAGISVYSPHTALDSVTGGINDWLYSCLTSGSQHGDYTITYVGEEKEQGLGGEGRLIAFETPLAMKVLEGRIKGHLKLDQIQVAYTSARDLTTISSVAICAGSGGSMLLGVDADVYFTGEMSHHEVLAAVASGHNVVLCGHTNTERGYLPILAKKLAEELQNELSDATDPAAATALQSLKPVISEADKHPLKFV